MFEQLITEKVRFTTERGILSYEDIYDIPLIGAFSLDSLARQFHKELNDTSKSISFVTKTKEVDKILQLKYDFILYVIDIKLKEREERELKAENKAKKEQILEIISEKEDDKLKGKSIDKLKKMLNSL